MRPQLPAVFGVDAKRAECRQGVTDMGSKLSYDARMKRLVPAACVLLAFALVVPVLAAQTASRAPSIRLPSQNFRTSTGPTFIPHTGFGPGFRSPTPCCGNFSGSFTFGVGTPANPFFPPSIGFHHHRGGFNNFGGGFNNFGGVIAVPYAVPVYPYPYGYDTSYQDQQNMQDQQDAADAQQEPPAPTIFERRARRTVPAPDTASYAADSEIAAPQAAAPDTNAAVTAAATQPKAAEPTSVLIFRDGHQLEVENYAIVGDTLYDLTPGHPRKIALASVDVPATVQANDDRGIVFRVPAN